MLSNRSKHKPRQVDFKNQKEDHECALLGAMGLSTYFINKQTGLSPSQITYRLKKAMLTRANGTSRTDFRNGASPFFEAYFKAARPIVDEELVDFLKKNLPL